MIQLEDAFITPPSAMAGFIFVARQMLGGAQAIHGATQEKPMVVTHLCGHSAETALKAVLVKCGLDQSQLRAREFGHNIENLWSRAVDEGVPLSSMPEWLIQLNRVHNNPYSVRYPLNFHAILLPNQSEMLAGCLALLNQTEAFCK